MSKYQPLGDFLLAHGTGEVPLTFAEIEKIIGAKLPPVAANRAWWSNNPSNNVMTKVWLAAGYETERVDMATRKLVFRRVENPRDQPVAAQAREGSGARHPLFGALKGLVQIPPGVDLTEPADPEWADLAAKKYESFPRRAG